MGGVRGKRVNGPTKPPKKFNLRDISLTMGAGGLMNRWGDHSILVPYFGGITQFQVPFMGGGDQ